MNEISRQKAEKDNEKGLHKLLNNSNFDNQRW